MLVVVDNLQAEECPRVNIYGPRRVGKEHIGSFYYTNERAGGVYRWEISGGEILKGQGSRGVEVRWSNQGGLLRVISSGSRCGSDSIEIAISVSKYVKDLPYYFPTQTYNILDDSLYLFGTPGEPYWLEKRPNFARYDLKSKQADKYFPVIYGKIDVCAGDEKNGYYLFGSEGSLTDYAGTAAQAIHIRPDGSISDWRPQFNFSRLTMLSLTRSDNWLIALDSRRSWNERALFLIHKITGQVITLPYTEFTTQYPVFLNDSTILSFGLETEQAGQNKLYKLTKLNINTLQIDTSINIVASSPQFGIYDSIIWVSNYFDPVSSSFQKIAFINANTGKLLKQPIYTDSLITSSLQKDNDSILYIFGPFQRVNDKIVNGAAAIDLTTGQVLDWNPLNREQISQVNVVTDKYMLAGTVENLDIFNGDECCPESREYREFADVKIYIFTRKDGALIDSISMRSNNFWPSINREFMKYMVHGDSIIIAGEYYGLKENSLTIKGIAGISLKDNSFWQAAAQIDSIKPFQTYAYKNSVFVMSYKPTNSYELYTIYKIDRDSGYRSQWSFSFTGIPASTRIYGNIDLIDTWPNWNFLSGVVEDSTYVYFSFAGSIYFNKPSGYQKIIRVNKKTGKIDDKWRLPDNKFIVTSLTLQADTLIAGVWYGDFEKLKFDQLTSVSMVAIDSKTAQPIAWPIVPNNVIRKITVNGNDINIAGRFNIVSPEFTNGFGIIRKNNGIPRVLGLTGMRIDGFRDIYHFAIHDSILYTAGHSGINVNEARAMIETFDLRTGQALDFSLPIRRQKGGNRFKNEIMGRTQPVNDLFYKDSLLVTTGLFTHIDDVYTGGIALIDVHSVVKPIVSGLAADETMRESSNSVWPNPAGDYLYYSGWAQARQLWIVDNLGIQYKADSNNGQIGTHTLLNGHYSLHVLCHDGSMQSHPFLILR